MVNVMIKYRIAVLILMIFLGCSSQEKTGEISLDTNFDNNLQKVASQKIYFGHQSVGNNIMEGLQEILASNQEYKLNIIESGDAVPDSGGFFLHTRIGENTKPNMKCDDFIQQLNPELVSKLDMAMFKFCYIDINRDTDVDALFEYYRNTISTVREKYPYLTIIHVTSPVRHSPDDFKTKIREVIGKFTGKPNNSKLDNARRNETTNNCLHNRASRQEPNKALQYRQNRYCYAVLYCPAS